MTLERADFRFDPSLGYWVADLGELAFVVEGPVEAPNPGRLRTAQQVVGDLAALEREGREYLRLFIDPAHLAARDQWQLESVEFGMNPDDLATTFALLFRLEGDQYGLWWVQFGFAAAPLERFFPNEFGRKQQ